MADDFDSESLRSLDGPKARTIDRSLNEFSIRRFFYGIGHWLCGYSSAGFAGGFDCCVNQGVGSARTGSILNGDTPSVGRKSFQTIPNGVLPPFATGNEVEF